MGLFCWNISISYIESLGAKTLLHKFLNLLLAYLAPYSKQGRFSVNKCWQKRCVLWKQYILTLKNEVSQEILEFLHLVKCNT